MTARRARNLVRLTSLIAGVALVIGVVQLATASPPPLDPVVAADHASAADPLRLAIRSPLAGADAPPSAWSEAWRLGIAQVAILLIVYAGGRAALDNRRWLFRRAPRAVAFLDKDKVWNLMASAITIAGTLLPLAISGDLDRTAVATQIAASVSLYVHSTRKPAKADAGSVAA